MGKKIAQNIQKRKKNVIIKKHLKKCRQRKGSENEKDENRNIRKEKQEKKNMTEIFGQKWHVSTRRTRPQ